MTTATSLHDAVLTQSSSTPFTVEPSPAPDATEMLDRIDATLDLIAEANHVSATRQPLDRVDVSILIPVHNVRDVLPLILDRIDEVMPPATEVIVIDDASDDGTAQYVRGRIRRQSFDGRHDADSSGENDAVESTGTCRTRLITRRRAHGRGSALRLGIRHSRGHVVAIQDPDFSLDPADLLAGVWPILEDQADAVYGTRIGRGHILDAIATKVSNHFNGVELSDLTHGQKVFRGAVLRSLTLSEPGVGFDAEVTSKFVAVLDSHPQAVGTMMQCPMPHVMDECEEWKASQGERDSGGLSDRIAMIRSAWRHRGLDRGV